MNTDFEAFVPISKSATLTGSEHGNYVRGWASTPSLDLEGDIVSPADMSIATFLKDGYINYEHKDGKDFIVGYPTRNSYVDPQKGFFLEAKLDMNNPYAKKMWDLANNVEKSDNGNSKLLGFSIHAKAQTIRRGGIRYANKVIVQNVALTTHPANPEATWETLVKSFSTGYNIGGTDQTGAAALREQDIGKQVSKLAQTLSDGSVKWSNIAKSMDSDDDIDYNPVTAQLLATLSTLPLGIEAFNSDEVVGNGLQILRSSLIIFQKQIQAVQFGFNIPGIDVSPVKDYLADLSLEVGNCIVEVTYSISNMKQMPFMKSADIESNSILDSALLDETSFDEQAFMSLSESARIIFQLAKRVLNLSLDVSEGNGDSVSPRYTLLEVISSVNNIILSLSDILVNPISENSLDPVKAEG